MTKQKEQKVIVTERGRTITDFLNKEYKAYSAQCTMERCTPSIYDGLRIGARKILHSALTGSLKNGEVNKLLVLVGDTMKLSLWEHGDASLSGSTVVLGSKHKMNLQPFDIIGQAGSLRDPNSCASPRYLYIKLSNYIKLWKTDYDLLQFREEEGSVLEPFNYLPTIPTILTFSQVGLSPGYKYQCMSYNPVHIIDACMEVLEASQAGNLENFDISTLIYPYVRGLNNKKSWKFEDGRWYSFGSFEVDVNKDKIDIYDLPYDMTFEGFEKLLNKKQDKEEIKDWKNFSEGEEIHYVVYLNKGACAKEYKRKDSQLKIWSQYKLRSMVPDDLLWVLDENQNVRHFDSCYDLIKYFVPLRLEKYNERKEKMVKILTAKIDKNNDLVKFIDLVCKGKLKIRNRSKTDIAVDMKEANLPMELISTPMSKCTIEEKEELLKENEAMKGELDYIKKTTTTQMYINDLVQLNKDIEKDFK